MNDVIRAAGGRVPTPSAKLPNASIDHGRLEAMCGPDDTLDDIAAKARKVAGLDRETEAAEPVATPKAKAR